MDFIERWFGISPDGGDGSLEALYLLAIVVVLAGHRIPSAHPPPNPSPFLSAATTSPFTRTTAL